MHELPQYKAAKDNPDINSTPRTYWAPKDLTFMEDKYMHEIFLLGMPSKFFCLTAPDSIWDPTRAPEGKHGRMWRSTPVLPIFLQEGVAQHADEFIDSMIEQWLKYRPQYDQRQYHRIRTITPIDIQDTHLDMREGSWCEGNMADLRAARFRGLPGGFRTFINNLYMCSSGVCRGGGIGRGSSYNCYQVIAEDFELPRPKY